ncbi:hypothetical protein NE857_15985 [Nocardiopsis exhalans]|uniref:RNA polymerase sigma-70 factor, ECF subfamily n=1 Tax=Nocardiopsis exhalans TaxID=163604 RepID=A0ABY5DF54_9ACTN|nr:hypothetical protein [Nocardiopsis exhalans]USY22981.1 hypothetical protein NE857_15985 [Nocardiopsis exhalans]
MADGRKAAEIDRVAARRVVEAFIAAASSGSTDRLVALLTDDVSAASDGAGLSGKVQRCSGARKVAVVNGAPAMVAVLGDRVLGLVVLEVRGGRATDVIGTASPERLDRFTEAWRRGEHDDPVVESW